MYLILKKSLILFKMAALWGGGLVEIPDDMPKILRAVGLE